MSIDILQWNVWYKETAENILRVIKENSADILCLQELTTTSQANPNVDIPAAISGLGYEHRYSIVLEREGEDYKREGCGIFSKFPILSHRQVLVQQADPTAQPIPRYNRVYLEVVVDAPGGPLTIGTTYLSLSDDFEMTKPRIQESQQLLAAIGSFDTRYILAGDLNATPDSWLIQSLLQHLHNVGPDFSEPTWTTKPFSYHGFEASELAWRLDHILATKDIHAEGARIITTDASDHLPIVCRLKI